MMLRSRNPAAAFALLGSALIGACGPSGSVLDPDESAALDPSRIEFQAGDLVIGRHVYLPCAPPQGGWKMELLPAGDPVTLDLYFIHQSPESPFPTWWPSDLQGVEGAGGAVLKTFNMGVIRARLPRTSPSIRPHTARVVPRSDRFDVQVTIGTHDPAVQETIVKLGGVVTRVSTNVGAIHAVIPDGAVPELRSHPSVRYIEHRGEGGCLYG